MYLIHQLYMPSSIVTFFHHGWPSRPLIRPASISAASPTWRRSLISLVIGFRRSALRAMVGAWMRSTSSLLSVRRALYDSASPRAGVVSAHSALVTGRCHWSGSEEEERRFRWR